MLARRVALEAALAAPPAARTQGACCSRCETTTSPSSTRTRGACQKAWETLADEFEAVKSRSKVTLIAAEKKGKPFARILVRGQYDQEGEQGRRRRPGDPSAPAQGGARQPPGTGAVADAAASTRSPPASTSTASGRRCSAQGLVSTAGEFGVTGEPPSNPKLLDWLAVEFRESGWDVKALFRLMVTSAAYRQSAVATPREAGEGRRQSPALARAALPDARRDDPRPRPSGLGSAVRDDRRPERQALPAAGHLGNRGDGREQHEDLRARPGRGQLSPQPLHLLEARGPAAGDGDLQRAHPRAVRRRPRADEHAAAGPGDVERRRSSSRRPAASRRSSSWSAGKTMPGASTPWRCAS